MPCDLIPSLKSGDIQLDGEECLPFMNTTVHLSNNPNLYLTTFRIYGEKAGRSNAESPQSLLLRENLKSPQKSRNLL